MYVKIAKLPMKSVLLFLFLSSCFFVQAQELTGIWRGNFKKTPVASNGRLMELLGGEERYSLKYN